MTFKEPEYTNFFEEISTGDDKETPPVEEPDTRAHILSPEELDAWKNGTDEGPVLRRAADVEAEEPPADPATPPATPVTPPEPVVVASLPTITATDPGDYEPNDYSFPVTIYDADNKNPRQITIASVEEFDQLLENDSNFGSYAALAKAQRQADKMESKSESDYAKWEADKATFDSESEQVNARITGLNNIANEMSYLVSKGELPAISKDLQDANWRDPEVAGQPGVKEQIALLAYMEKENTARAAAGLAPMTSALDAWNAYQLEQSRTTQADQRTAAAQQRKAAGAKVGGSQPAQATQVPRGIAVGRVSPGGLRDMGAKF